jgi:hypothetical protein
MAPFSPDIAPTPIHTWASDTASQTAPRTPNESDNTNEAMKMRPLELPIDRGLTLRDA